MASGAIDLVLPGRQLVTILADDFAGCFSVSDAPVSDADRHAVQRVILAGARHARQARVGTPIDLKVGMVVRRTGRPFRAGSNHYAPPGHPLEILDVAGGSPAYDDMEEFKVGHFPGHYASDAYFEVVAQIKPTAPLVRQWLTKLRDQITDRSIVREDLEPQLTEFGLVAPAGVMAYWLEHLNDRTADLDKLMTYLDRLVDLYISPPSLVEGRMDAMYCMDPGKLRALLREGPTDQWRKTLICIGLVLRYPEQFGGAETVEAAQQGLQKYDPR